MNAAWIRLAKRLNALSVRERVIMAASLAAALAAVVDVFVLTPQFAAQRALVAQMRAQGAELQVLRTQLAADTGAGPQAALQRDVAARRSHSRPWTRRSPNVWAPGVPPAFPSCCSGFCAATSG